MSEIKQINIGNGIEFNTEIETETKGESIVSVFIKVDAAFNEDEAQGDMKKHFISFLSDTIAQLEKLKGHLDG